MPLKTSIAFVLLGFLVFIGAEARREVIVNAFGPLGGKYSVSYEHGFTERLGIAAQASYEDGQAGLLSSLLYPVNIERMYNLAGSVGLPFYLFKDGEGFYALPELALGYHSTRMRPRHTPSLDSLEAKGFLAAPTLKAGYKWVLRERYLLAPEAGAAYVFNTADFSRISQLPSAEDEDAFVFSKRQLKAYNSGLRPLIALKAGFRF